jgi:kynureninase
MKFENSLSFARNADRLDSLKKFRKDFLFPVIKGKRQLYFTGNSLGLQPKNTARLVSEELKDWSRFGVEGHLHSRRPWLYYHHFSTKSLAKITGASPYEVVAMNQLTVNLHLMMVSFYRPVPGRFKIIMEQSSFPSDRYAVESQIKFHGFDPADALIEIAPRPGELTLRTADILSVIHEHRNSTSLVLFSGVQYYTGQFFDIPAITRAAHAAGALAGFDLAHTIGNVPLNLHKDGVDFAVWCGYKYLNSGPGGLAGVFVHEKHAADFSLPRFAGWWGHQEKVRFKMEKDFIPMRGAEGWQLSNFPVLAGAAQLAALEIFDKTSMAALRKKSLRLTGYLEFLLKNIHAKFPFFEIITPSDPKQRGCQLSLLFHKRGHELFKKLTANGIIVDWREPNVIRVAPVPLYNSFEDLYRFSKVLSESISK